MDNSLSRTKYVMIIIFGMSGRKLAYKTVFYDTKSAQCHYFLGLACLIFVLYFYEWHVNLIRYCESSYTIFATQ